MAKSRLWMGTKDIYNSWSSIHFPDKREVGAYWANIGSNAIPNIYSKSEKNGNAPAFSR